MTERTSADRGWLSGAWPLLALAAGVVLVYMGSVHDVGGFLYDYDARYWHRGGVCWWRGISPYDLTDFTAVWHEDFVDPPHDHGAFVYPPTILPLSLLLGVFPWDAARHVMRLLNYLCLFGIALALWRVVPRTVGGAAARAGVLRFLDDGRTWLLACALLNSVALALNQGQMSLVVTLGVCLVLVGWRNGTTWPVVVGVLLASMKPQITIIPMLYLAFRIADRRLVVGLVVTALVGAAAFLWSPPLEVFADLRASLDSHMTQGFNQLDHYDAVTGLLGGTALAKPALWAGMLAGMGVAVWIARRRAASTGGAALTEPWEWRALQLVLVLEAAVMPLHRYDLALLVVLVASLGIIPGARRRILLFGLLLAHGHLYMIAWHMRARLGLDVGMQVLASSLASVLAGVELALVAGWWWLDARGSGAVDERA